MTTLGRSTTIRLLVVSRLVLAATAWPQMPPPMGPQQMAKTYGRTRSGRSRRFSATRSTWMLGATTFLRVGLGPQGEPGSYAGE